ncbi:MAG: exonuclease, partial [Flavobacteriaceae bacterium]|nr:exonuclease [Flavobacteriaceae bacterium]
GRRKEERSVIYIKNGKLQGVGFYDLNFQISNTSILESLITKMRDTKTAQHIVKSYLRKSKYKKILNLSESIKVS